LVRVDEEYLRPRGNRDSKRRLTPEGESRIVWVYGDQKLPPNLLLRMDAADRERVLTARVGSRATSGQARLKELFRTVQGEIVRRAVICTVGMQDDSMKRARDCRLQKHLGREGFLILGHQEQDPDIAAAFGLPRPAKGEFVSVRVHPALPGDPGSIEIDGGLWRVARPEDPVVPAPAVPRANSSSDGA
jgi:hypothetical protein